MDPLKMPYVNNEQQPVALLGCSILPALFHSVVGWNQNGARSSGVEWILPFFMLQGMRLTLKLATKLSGSFSPENIL